MDGLGVQPALQIFAAVQQPMHQATCELRVAGVPLDGGRQEVTRSAPDEVIHIHGGPGDGRRHICGVGTRPGGPLVNEIANATPDGVVGRRRRRDPLAFSRRCGRM